MGRRQRCRWVGYRPVSVFYKPRGIPSRSLEEITLTLGEFEAIRLSDLMGLHHDEAAGRMRISRQTFGRILSEAHRKVAECFAYGKALRIEGGNYAVIQSCLGCYDCGFIWEIPCEFPLPAYCPECGGTDIRVRGKSYSENFQD